ncbi:hypothetical protein E2C01_053593 [Portunus trituberculatus]|uniref:Uncharacterized protein n=1 Tax=Portunus trituberculatus TaxID=210409 RepID=A0A5B7GH64_PORTR|nr:hypothetical protein [Portunus trituberculatus]
MDAGGDGGAGGVTGSLRGRPPRRQVSCCCDCSASPPAPSSPRCLGPRLPPEAAPARWSPGRGPPGRRGTPSAWTAPPRARSPFRQARATPQRLGHAGGWGSPAPRPSPPPGLARGPSTPSPPASSARDGPVWRRGRRNTSGWCRQVAAAAEACRASRSLPRAGYAGQREAC